MVLTWSGGTLEEYAHLRNSTATGAWDAGDGASSYVHGSRYPLDELLAADSLGTGGVRRKWLLCFFWAMGAWRRSACMHATTRNAHAHQSMPCHVPSHLQSVSGYAAAWEWRCAGLFTGLNPVELEPWREEELAFNLVVLVFAMAFNAMIISSCASLMAAMDYIARHHKAKLDRVRDYLRFNQVPAELSNTILEYYKYICLNAQTSDDLRDFVDLPQQLNIKLVIAINRELINHCPLLKEFDNHSILRILFLLRPLTLPPDTVVLRQGQPHPAMYFVSRGMLWVVDHYQSSVPEAPERIVNVLGNHEFFGDDCVLSGATPEHSVVAKTYCVLMALTKSDFDTAQPRLKGGPTLREMTKQFHSFANLLGAIRRHGRHGEANGQGMKRSGTAGSRIFGVLAQVRKRQGASGLSDSTCSTDAGGMSTADVDDPPKCAEVAAAATGAINVGAPPTSFPAGVRVVSAREATAAVVDDPLQMTEGDGAVAVEGAAHEAANIVLTMEEGRPSTGYASAASS